MVLIFWLLSVASAVIVGTKYRDIIDAIEELKGHHESLPTEIVIPNPRKYPPAQSDSGSVVLMTKTPRQLEREAEEDSDRKSGLL